MEQVLQITNQQIKGNGEHKSRRKSQPKKAGSPHNKYHSIFDPNKYMLKLPKSKKVKMSNGQIKWEQTEADYLPVAARIAWFRRDHPDWSIITKTEQLANKGVVMKAIVKDANGRTDNMEIRLIKPGSTSPTSSPAGERLTKIWHTPWPMFWIF